MELTAYSDRAVDLVNSGDPLRPERDALASVDRLREFLSGYQVWQRKAGQRDLAPLRGVRDRLRHIFELAAAGHESAAVDGLNVLLREYPISPQVSAHDGTDWHLHLAEGTPSVAEAYAAGTVMGLAMFCTELGVSRLGVCQAPPCRQVYLDTSTNRSRRYCSERCATRANVAAYRQRRREQVAGA
ncbi:MAG TPA: CGNR zinc finger domain-containing protein [Actinomycetes bacterium]|nr:CGNR zinc finger domain-containing protein [Actinomycetes bacterium]